MAVNVARLPPGVNPARLPYFTMRRLNGAVGGWGNGAPLPGAGRPSDALSATSTQSLLSGGVNVWDPVVGKVPTIVELPERGLNHHAVALEPPTFDMSTVTARCVGMYAMTEAPSLVRA